MKRRGEPKAEADELGRITAALLVCLVRELKDPTDQIQIMDSFGVSSPTIAKALGKNPVSVRTALHRRRREGKRE